MVQSTSVSRLLLFSLLIPATLSCKSAPAPAAPQYLTVSSSGPAGKVQYNRMGVYQQSGETHNNKPVWARYDGTKKLFYDNKGHWLIGLDPARNGGGVSTVDPAGDLWPHQVSAWKYSGDRRWQTDPLLTVTEGRPGYPDNLKVEDLTGVRANLAGAYRRQGDSRVWKYGDYKLSFNGKLWCITGNNLDCQPLSGWDYADDFIVPNTDTLYMIDYPASITVTSTGEAADYYSWIMGRYVLDENKTALLRPVYKKTDGDYYIFYSQIGSWSVHEDYTSRNGWMRSEKRGLLTIPTSGWEYSDGRKWVGGDDTLMFTSSN